VNKRAYFYTIIGVMLIVMLLLLMDFRIDTEVEQSSEATISRVIAMDLLLDDLQKDIDRAVYITGFRALTGVVDYVIESGNYIDDSEQRLREAFENGTVYGEQLTVLVNSSMSDWITKIIQLSEQRGFNLSLSINRVNFSMKSPWKVAVSTNLSVQLTDFSNTASWKTTIGSQQDISIVNFEDPVYMIMSFGRVFNVINVSNITDFVVGNDTTNLKFHINHSLYISSELAPDFLMRLEGNFSSSQFGIESLVYLPEFSQQELPVYERSCVDYLYACGCNESLYIVNDTYESWFRLDEQHLAVYQAEDVSEPAY